MTTPPCDHVPGGECCNLDRLACPQHFTHLMTRMMTNAAPGGDDHAVHVAAHDLSRHAWTTQAVMTMCALIEHFGRSAAETVEEAMARVATDTSTLPPAERADKHPWVFRLGVLARAAIAGDGDQIAAVIADLSARRDPAMTPQRTLSLFASLAMAAHQCTQAPRRDTGRDLASVATFLILGSQTQSAHAYRMLVPLATMTDSFRRETPPQEAARRIITASQHDTVAAVGVVGRTLGQVVDPDGPVLFTADGVGGPPAGHDVTGMINWADTSLDSTRENPEMYLVLAMRAAVLFAVDDTDAAVDMIEAADDPRAHARNMILGGCAMLANMVAGRLASAGA